jgi:hypothetical protein
VSDLKYVACATPTSTFMYRGRPCKLIQTGVDTAADNGRGRVVALVLGFDDGGFIEVTWSEEAGFDGVTYELLQ